jgi:hypothetical protein
MGWVTPEDRQKGSTYQGYHPRKRHGNELDGSTAIIEQPSSMAPGARLYRTK